VFECSVGNLLVSLLDSRDRSQGAAVCLGASYPQWDRTAVVHYNSSARWKFQFQLVVSHAPIQPSPPKGHPPVSHPRLPPVHPLAVHPPVHPHTHASTATRSGSRTQRRLCKASSAPLRCVLPLTGRGRALSLETKSKEPTTSCSFGFPRLSTSAPRLTAEP